MESIQIEQFQTKAGRVAYNGVVPGVSVITMGEAKGHGVHIDEGTLSTLCEVAKGFPDGVKVKMDHGSGVGAIIGTLKTFRVDGDRVRADLHLLKNHPNYALLTEMIVSQPHSFGMSIRFSQGKREIGGKTYADVLDLLSVDIVDAPAANPSGLFAAPSTKPLDLSAKLTPDTFPVVVFQRMREANCTKASAVEFCTRAYQQTYRKWLESGDTANLSEPSATGAFSDLVARKVAGGMSKAAAVEFCVSNFTASYAAWRESGNTAVI